MTHTIAGIGEILWDYLPYGRVLGGAPANVAYHVNALGGNGYIVSGIGNDRDGRDILEKLDRLGINRQYITIHPAYPTGTARVEIDSEGSANFTISENSSWDRIPLTPWLLKLAVQADAIVFGTLAQRSETTKATIRKFVSTTRPEAFRVLDLNLRYPHYSEESLHWSLEFCNILKLNENELKVIAQTLRFKGNLCQILEQVLDRFHMEVIALTLGKEGSLLYSKKEHCSHNGYVTSMIDTVGAGDAFTAALILGVLEGLNLERISDYANRVASYVCSQPGATPPMPQDLHISRYLIPQLQPNDSGSCA